MFSIQNISPPSLTEDNHQQGMFQGENDSKQSKETVCANSDSFADCEVVTPTQIKPPESAPHENSVNVDNVVIDCDDTEVITNKPSQNDLMKDDLMTQVTNFVNKQPFENKPNKNGVSEDIPTKIKENEGILLNTKHVKKNFDEVIDQFKRALQSPRNIKSEIQNDPNENVITSDKADESESINVDYNNVTLDNKGQREKSNDGLVVSSNTDDEIVQCHVDGNVTNNIKDENEIKNCGRGLPSQEQMDVFNENANVTTLTNVSYSSDEESSPKRSRQFTSSDSYLPNDDEINEILMMYPKPTFIESFSESESSSEDESNRPICRRRRNKPEPVDLTKMLEILPEKVLTRLRKQPVRLGFEDKKKNSAILKPTYLIEQENEIDGDIIAVNIRRWNALKFEKRNTNKYLKKQKSVKEEKKKRSLRKKAVIKSNKHKKNIKVKPKRKNAISKSKSNVRKSAELKIKNTKDSLVSKSVAKTTTTRTRSMKKENDGKNTQNKRKLQENRKKETNCKQKLTNMKERSRLAENKVRRSKRQPRAKQKNHGTTKAPISIFKQTIHEQSTVYNISPFSSKSPKSLKRSFVDKSDVSSPKRTRLQNTNNNQELNNNNTHTQQGHLTAIHSKELQQDKRGPYVYLEKYEPEPQKRTRKLNSNRKSLNMKTQSQTRMLSRNRNSLNIKTLFQSRMLNSNRNSLNMETQSQTQTRMQSRNRNSLNIKSQSQSQTRILSRNRYSLNIQTQTRMLNSNRNSLNMETQTQTRMLSRNRNSLNIKTQSQSQTKMLNSNRNSLNMETQSQAKMLNSNRNSLNIKTQSQSRMLNSNRNSLNMETQSQTRMMSRNRNSLNIKAQSQTRMLNSNRNSLNMETQSQIQTRMLNSNKNSLNMETQSQTRMLSRNRKSLNIKTKSQSQTRILSRNRNSLNMNTQSQTRMLSCNRKSLNIKTKSQSQTRILSRNRNSLNMNTQSQTRMLSRNRNLLNIKTQSQPRMLNSNRNSLNMKTRTQSARRNN